jgi:hypothetical protein
MNSDFFVSIAAERLLDLRWLSRMVREKRLFFAGWTPILVLNGKHLYLKHVRGEIMSTDVISCWPWCVCFILFGVAL